MRVTRCAAACRGEAGSAPLTAIPALTILDLVLPSRHGFGAHPGGGLLERIFLLLELLWFLLAALRLTQASVPRLRTRRHRPAVPPGPAQSLPPGP